MTEARAEETVLDVKNLQTVFFTDSGLFKAVDDVSFHVRRGETLAIVGESGCGKSVSALSIMRLVPDPPGRIVGGTVTLEGTDLLGIDEAAMRKIRGNRMSMIFQEPMTSLNPVMRIGDADHRGGPTAPGHVGEGSAGRKRASRCCGWSGFPSRSGASHEYPHQLSGGMRQRVDDRDGAGLPPGTADRRRADHGARRHDPGADPGADRRPAEDARHWADPDHPRPRRGRGDRAARDRDVCRQEGRGGDRRGTVRQSAPSLYARPDGLDAGGALARHEGGRAADRNSRHGAVADQSAARLRLRAALPAARSIAAAPNIRRCRIGGESSGGVLARSRDRWPRHDRRRARCSRSTDLVKHYPVRGGILRRAIGTVHAVDGVSFIGRRRRDAGPGRRIRLRQVDGGAQRAAPGRADQRAHPAERHGHHPPRQGASCGRTGARCRSSSRIRLPRSIRA